MCVRHSECSERRSGGGLLAARGTLSPPVSYLLAASAAVMVRYGKLFSGWMGSATGRSRSCAGHRLLVAGLLMALLAPMLISCTTTSQIPLSVRERMERESMTEQEHFEADDPAQSPVVNRAELELRERERQRMLEQRDARMQEQTNLALGHYVRAQTSFYDGRFEQALRFVRLGQSIQQTADLLALEGSILWFLDEREQAAERWELAMSLDEEVVGALYPGLSEWVASVQDSESDTE